MLKIMIVDDDFIVRRGMCEAIAWDRYDAQVIAQADDGIDALEKMAQYEPDVIFCDVVMPRMNGLVLLGEIRAKWPWVKMVMVSAHDKAAYVRQALQGEAVDYLLKPFQEEDVARVLACVRERIAGEQVLLSYENRESPQFLFTAKAHIQAVAQALGAYSRDQALTEACALFYTIRAGSIQSRLLITSLCVELFVDVMRILQEAGAEASARAVAEQMSEISRYHDLQTLEAMVLRCIGEVGEKLMEAGNRSTLLAVKARSLIEESYAQNLTVSMLSERLHVSGNTLQRIFKEEVGCTIRQYIINTRVDRAKHLLRATHEKVYAVGSAVGYQDTDFFTKTFAKVTGMTPQQYRETSL